MVERSCTQHLGIFLTYGPTDVLRKEGISRLIGVIMKALEGSPDCRLTVAIPRWGIVAFDDLLNDHGIARDRLTILTTPTVPVLVRFLMWRRGLRLQSPRQGKGRWRKLKASLASRTASFMQGLYFIRQEIAFRPTANAWIYVIEQYSAKWLRALWRHFLTSSNLFIMVLIAPILLLLVVLAGLAFVPLALTVLAYRLFCKFKRTRSVPIAFVGNKKYPTSAKALSQHIKDYIYLTLLGQEAERLVKVCNATDVGCWFVPSPIWDQTVALKAPVCVAVPDIIFNDFPTYFSDYYLLELRRKAIKSIHAADSVICYSDYVRDKHLIRDSGCPPAKINVIKHGRHNLAPLIQTSRRRPIDVTVYQTLQKYAYEKLGSLRAAEIFMQEPYLVFTSQFRGYKNTERLIGALRLVIDKTDRPLNLVLTGQASDPDIDARIKRLGLQPRVMFAHNLSSTLLAAVNLRAQLSVNPSLFEGGFPATFAEAYSVGTPSVMARIPATTEIITSPALQAVMLFDPYETAAIAERIIYGLNNRAVLYEQQAAVYQNLPSWEAVASDYLRCFGMKASS